MRSKALLVAGAGAALIALTACGPNNITGSAGPTGGNGGSASQAQGAGEKISTVADLGSLVQHNADAKNSVHMNMDMNVGGMGDITATGEMKFGSQVAMDMTMQMSSLGSFEMRMVDGTLYMKMPDSLSQTAGTSGKPWVKLDLNGSDAISKSLGSQANLAQNADPTQMINKMKDAGTITSTSSDTVDGQPATHYAITVDVAKMVANSGATTDQEKQAMEAAGIKSMPMDVWVNSDNLPVKITTKMAMNNPASGQAMQMDLTVNYTQWGAPVNISAPSPDQVGSLGGN